MDLFTIVDDKLDVLDIETLLNTKITDILIEVDVLL